MSKKLFACLLTLILSLGYISTSAQELEKSEVIEAINGKEYYIHSVEAGQTLYALSKVYDVPVDELEFENPDAADGLSIGELLRIPLVSREKIITNDLRKGEFRYIFHIVKNGQTLYGISRIYSVPLDDLKKANPEWVNGLKPGQYLKIPMKEEKKLTPVDLEDGNGKKHIVSRGETLYSISRKYKVGMPELKAANPGISNSLSVGQEVHIPMIAKSVEVQEEEKKYREHTVRAKETLYGIARQYRISIDSLMAFNPGLSTSIFPGEVIRIPMHVNQNEYITHTVKERTKLKKIASKYAVSVSSMKEANPEAGRRVSAGDVLLVPLGPLPVREPDDVHMVVTPVEDHRSKKVKSDSLRCYERMYTYHEPLKVALMIPLYAEEAKDIEVDGQSTPDPSRFKSFNFIQFYEGFLMAAEALDKEGLELELHVYDVDEKVSKTIQVLQRAELADMDLIIGPFFSRNFKLVSNFAEMFDIKIVNPLTRRTEVLKSSNVYKVKPSRDAQIPLLVNFIEDYHPEANIILVRNNSFQYADEMQQIKSSLEKVIPYGVKVSNMEIFDLINEYSEADTNLPAGTLISSMMIEDRKLPTEQVQRDISDSTFLTNGIGEVVYASDSVYGIIRNASIARKNLVIVLSNNEIFVPEVLTRLNDLKDTFDISVVGMPEWEMLDNLEVDYLLDLDVHFFTDHYIDPADPGVEAFVGSFREKYLTQPDQYAFEGYDIATYFLEAMMRFGPDCEKCLPYYRKDLIKSGMHIRAAFPAGYENTYWNLCRYWNYRIEKIPVRTPLD